MSTRASATLSIKFAVEAFVAQGAVKALDMPILPRAAGFDIERLDPAPDQPLLEHSGDKLRAIVTADVLGQPSFAFQPFHRRDQVMGRQLAGHVQLQALPAVFIQDRQNAQPASVVRAICHEVPRPDVIEPFDPRRDDSRRVD